MDNDKYLKGTTTVGVVCTDGIVLASEQRATMGNFIASKTAKKVYQIDDRVAMTIAGSVGDAQQLVRLVNVESQLYKMRRNESMTISNRRYGAVLFIFDFDCELFRSYFQKFRKRP